MHTSRFAFGRFVAAALVAVAGFAGARAEDDFVKDDEPAAPPVWQPAIGGQLPGGGRVIVMPGLQLQFGGPGQMQIQAGAVAPQPAAAAGEPRAEPFLGVVAGPVAPPIRAQLDLPEGVGLSVNAVAAGGPAEKAGVKRFDVIHKFNDQVVCSPEQLTTLVRVVGVGTKVSLAIVRGGRERELEAVIEERVVPAVAAGQGMQQVVPGMPEVLNLEQMIAPGFVGAGFGPAANAEIERKVGEALARAGVGVGGGGWPLNAVVQAQTGFQMVGPGGMSVTTMSGAQGTVEVRTVGGRRTVTLKDPDGNEVYSGPLDTDEDFDTVPEEYRQWVREVIGGFPVLPALNGGDEPGPEPAEQPAERATEDGPAESAT